jgi:hypothetical protein
LRKFFSRVTSGSPRIRSLLIFLYHTYLFEIRARIGRKKIGLNAERGIVDFREFAGKQKVQKLFGRPKDVDSIEQLKKWLDATNVAYVEGGWTIYVQQPEKLLSSCNSLVYPKNFGLKILKDFKGTEHAKYTPNESKPTPGASGVRSRTPNLTELLRIGSVSHSYGIGPRIFDLIDIEFGGACCSAFVVENIRTNCSQISLDEYESFLETIDETLERGVIKLAHGDRKHSSDFKPYDCNGNLIKSDTGELYYVDFQSFVFENELLYLTEWMDRFSDDVLFGPARFGKKTYSYQLVPGVGEGKRSTLERFSVLDVLFRDAGVEISGKLTFDIGCNTGLMSYYGLTRGAKWAFGWDRSMVITAANDLMAVLGATRWTGFAKNITEDTNFTSDLADLNHTATDAVLFYLAVSDHIGFPRGLKDLPWTYLVYEGHNNQTLEESILKIHGSTWGVLEVQSSTLIEDGDSLQRPLILLKRNDFDKSN